MILNDLVTGDRSLNGFIQFFLHARLSGISREHVAAHGALHHQAQSAAHIAEQAQAAVDYGQHTSSGYDSGTFQSHDVILNVSRSVKVSPGSIQVFKASRQGRGFHQIRDPVWTTCVRHLRSETPARSHCWHRSTGDRPDGRQSSRWCCSPRRASLRVSRNGRRRKRCRCTPSIPAVRRHCPAGPRWGRQCVTSKYGNRNGACSWRCPAGKRHFRR